MRKKLKSIVHILRINQWVKNALVAAPLVFSGSFLNPEKVIETVIAIALFCLAASLVFIINDIADINADTHHPKKKNSPLASGDITMTTAIIVLISLYIPLVAASFFYPALSFCILMYMLIHYAYSFYLKNVPVINTVTIAVGYVIRVHAGAVAISFPISHWIPIATFTLALFLVSVKQRQEYLNTPK